MALAFSCLSGILGVIVVAWYGLAPDPGSHPKVEQRVAEALVVDGPVSNRGEAVKNDIGTEIVTTVSGGTGRLRS